MTTVAEAMIIDIHAHYRPDAWTVGPERTPISFSPELIASLSDLEGLKKEGAEAGVSLRALSAPPEQLWGPVGDISTKEVNAVNEWLADAVQEKHAGAFLGLATIDAFSGDAGAEQTRYAVETLKLDGIVLDSSRGDQYLSSPKAYPTLELAAQLEVPVFVHPVAANESELFVRAAGRNGNSLGRGTQNGLALLSALHADLPEKLPGLHLVFTSLGNGALYFAAETIDEYRSAHGAAPNLYFDTTRFNSALIRYYGETLGVDRIIVGTDYPGRNTSQEHTESTLVAAGFDDAQRDLIRSGNARRLFQLRKEGAIVAAASGTTSK
jgi:predicted TIM-barrel fold metal-dependent hydrolase